MSYNNKSTEHCPCIKCICKPICKHKSYTHLFKECILLSRYISNYGNKHERNHLLISILQESLKPTKWRYRGGGFIHDVTGAVFNAYKR